MMRRKASRARVTARKREDRATGRVVAARASRRACSACGACSGEPRCGWIDGVLGDGHRPDLLGARVTARWLPTVREGVAHIEPVVVVEALREGSERDEAVLAVARAFLATHRVLMAEVGGAITGELG